MSKRRVLILTLGSRGDVQPYIAVGKALLARGHDVTVATAQGFDALIEDHGLHAAPLSINFQALIEAPEMVAALHSFRGKIAAWRSMKGLIQQQLDEMWLIAQDTAPNLILYHPKAPVTPYMARALGAVAIPSFLQPGFVSTGEFPPPFVAIPDWGRSLNRLAGKAMIGLIALGYRAILRPWLARHRALQTGGRLASLEGYHPSGARVPRLHAYSRHIVAKPSEWGAHDHVTGAWFLDQPPGWSPPADLARFLATGSPPVYIGFGSMRSYDAAKLTREVLNAVRQSGTRAVISTGWGALVDMEVPDGVHVLGDVPHDWLFPRCRAVVHHGGAGTTQVGLRYGRPTLVCPAFGDQPFWGKRVSALGAGPDPIALLQVTSSNLAKALRSLTEPPYVRKAQQLGEAIGMEWGAETAADLIVAPI